MPRRARGRRAGCRGLVSPATSAIGQLVILVLTRPALFSRSGSGVADRAIPRAGAALTPRPGTVPVIVKVTICPDARPATDHVVMDKVTRSTMIDLVLPPALGDCPTAP
jgi:hypothetical protein